MSARIRFDLFFKNASDTTPTQDGTNVRIFTLGVSAAREAELSEAIHYGQLAIAGDRKSVPSILMVSRDLTPALAELYASELKANDYRERLQLQLPPSASDRVTYNWYNPYTRVRHASNAGGGTALRRRPTWWVYLVHSQRTSMSAPAITAAATTSMP
ncbi:hypothetical protein [Nocardia sp. R7R-8]|uniref:hypothetical protein n=1 Tax=Nocardia sp. R7R-8 TaxID=3459304 RepID=UPI00403D55E7